MITFVPVGGLANRMRSIASALSLARDLNTGIHIIWFKDKGLNCRFTDIFEPIRSDNLLFREAGIKDLLMYDRPRKKNLWLPAYFQYLYYSKRLYEAEVASLRANQFDFFEWAKHSRPYLASYDMFYPLNYTLNQLFVPLPSIRKRIEEKKQLFRQNTIGIHIRRTDHTTSTQESPTSFFMDFMDKEIQKDQQVMFYMASDSEEEKAMLKARYPDRILSSERVASRIHRSGIEDAVVDMYLLASTRKIAGSSQSSFSEVAAMLYNTEHIVLKK